MFLKAAGSAGRALASRPRTVNPGVQATGLHSPRAYRAGIGRFHDGALAEVFLSTLKPGSQAETGARDAAIAASIALQFGAPAETIRGALARLGNGNAAGPLGRALDLAEGASA